MDSRHQAKTQKNKTQAVPETDGNTLQLVDNRRESAVQRKLQDLADNSPRGKQTAQLQSIANQHAQETVQRQPNKTGLPDNLKSGIENLSGHSLADVKVHYNSNQPGKLQAHAFAQGSDIHLAPGQEKHLPHEAWHVVQQKQGRVKPTIQMKQGTPVNDDPGLEKEADVMGAKSLTASVKPKVPPQKKSLPKKGKKVKQMKFRAGSDGISQEAPHADGAVAQLLITYNKKSKTYSKNGKRSGWHTYADQVLLSEYNDRLGVSLPKITYDSLKLCRNHIGSFDGLQRYIVEYLNGGSQGDFHTFIIDFTDSIDHSSDEYAKIIAARNALNISILSGDTSDIVADANKLLSLLNNLSENLRAADKYINSYIQERPDLVFTRKPDGTFSLNKQSRKILSMGSKHWGDIPLTPGGQGIATSQGRVDKGSLSPTSKTAISGYPQTRVQIKSDKVKDRLHGSNAHSNFKGPKPKINLGPSSSSSLPVFQPPTPRYINPQTVHTFPDGTIVQKFTDTLTHGFEFAHFNSGGKFLQSLGPHWTPPPRYKSISREHTNQDGTTVWKALDTHTNLTTFVQATADGKSLIKDLGPHWTPPPQYISGQKEFTNNDGTTVWKYLDTHTNHWTFLKLDAGGTTFIQDLGPHWTPPRYQNPQLEYTYSDGTTVYKFHDTHTNAPAFMLYTAGGAQYIKDLGPHWTPPPRYTDGTHFANYAQGKSVWKYLDNHSNKYTYLYLDANHTLLQDLGPSWKPD